MYAAANDDRDPVYLELSDAWCVAHYRLEDRLSPAWLWHDREVTVPVVVRLDGCDEDGRPIDLTPRYRTDAEFRAEVDHELGRHLAGLADAAAEYRAGVYL